MWCDGVLIEFASVVDAVQCAAVIQRRMSGRDQGVPDEQPMRFRVGINLGDIIVEADDIYGDGVNIAARLQGIAEPGGIFISGTAFDQVAHKVDVGFVALGEHRLMGRGLTCHVPGKENRPFAVEGSPRAAIGQGRNPI
ncbi:adenylate class-3/4/guanylyl cyclase [Rhizobium grahamii CCGE 502]|uniref:Adenylate class-3/4/guanylyl cyclase n=1 Tax=Rhizobium grahamii CCGE 502 TaxID=990285 RepID=S3HEG1_9HYPH|nr:adenylate class-3/4/guanylyl cyclase [Rhizobium grahamii CCGE 502]